MAPQRSRRTAGTVISWWALALGMALGLTAGLIYTWEIDPVVERNTAPWQLGADGREAYVVAVALSYAQGGDLNHAFDRLRALRPNRNVWQMVADVACGRVRTGKTVSNADIRVIRALEDLYLPQGASGCADGLYPTPAPMAFASPVPSITQTPSLTPPATKTATPPLPDPTAAAVPAATPTLAAGRFVVTRVQAFCNADLPGIIEVRVFDRQGRGVVGVPVTATWRGNQNDTFYTGLKAERDPGYADFAMEAGRSYSVSIPNLGGDTPTVEATECTVTVGGERVATLSSYWVNFQQQ